EQRGGPNPLGLAAFDPQLGKRAVGEVIDTQTVFEAGMIRRRIHQLDGPELANVAKALDGRGVEKLPGHPRDLDVVVNAVLDRFHWHVFGAFDGKPSARLNAIPLFSASGWLIPFVQTSHADFRSVLVFTRTRTRARANSTHHN